MKVNTPTTQHKRMQVQRQKYKQIDDRKEKDNEPFKNYDASSYDVGSESAVHLETFVLSMEDTE